MITRLSNADRFAAWQEQDRWERGVVLCPTCETEVYQQDLQRCRCGRKICIACGQTQVLAQFENELLCGRYECEHESLTMALRTAQNQLSRDVAAAHDEYDIATAPIIKRLAEIAVLGRR